MLGSTATIAVAVDLCVDAGAPGGAPATESLDLGVLGVVSAGLAADPRLQVHLVGPADQIRTQFSAELEAWLRAGRIVVHDAAGQVAAHEDAAVVRGRPRLPVRVALDLLAAGVVHAVRSRARVDVVMTAASFRLGRLPQGGTDRGGEAARVRAAARPGSMVSFGLPAGQLRIVDAGWGGATRPIDLVGRLLAVAQPGDRCGLLDATGQRGPFVREAVAIADQATDTAQATAQPGVEFCVVSAEDAVAGVVDVVGCTPDPGAVMMQVLRATGASWDGHTAITGVPGDVGALAPQAASLGLRPRRAGVAR